MTEPVKQRRNRWTPMYDLLGYGYCGPCIFCGANDKRHRMTDAIRGRDRAGEPLVDIAKDYNMPLKAVVQIVNFK